MTPDKEDGKVKNGNGVKVIKSKLKKKLITPKKKRNILFNIVISILFISVIVLLTRNSYYLVEGAQENKQLTSEFKSVKNELAKSKARIEGVKGQDDLLKRDIELYVRNTYRKVPKVIARTIASIVVDLSKTEEVSPELIVGIIQVESQFNPMAIGPKTKYGNARGLMQVMPEWAKKFELDSLYDLHDVDINITCGIRVFKIHLKESKGNISKGLYLYVNKDKSYVDKVYNAMGRFVSFRSTIDDSEKSEESDHVNNEPTETTETTDNNGEKEIEEKSGPNKAAEKSS